MSVEQEEFATVTVDHSPTRVSSIAAVGAAVIAGLTSAPFALYALPLGFGGIAVLASGLFMGSSRLRVTMGAAGLFLSVLIAGLFGTGPEILLVSAAATILAWNFGQNAISLGEQIGSSSRTRRNEIIHASAATIVAMVATGVGYGVYLIGSGGRPMAAVGMLSLALVFLIWAIRT
ncbi:DUF7519 family protein [Halosimplex sp. J119]